MTITVHHHDVVGRHRVVPNHFVRGAGAVGHKETMVSIKNTCRVALALADRTVVVEQLAKFFYRIAYVGTQHVFAIELVIHLTYGAFQERYAS